MTSPPSGLATRLSRQLVSKEAKTDRQEAGADATDRPLPEPVDGDAPPAAPREVHPSAQAPEQAPLDAAHEAALCSAAGSLRSALLTLLAARPLPLKLILSLLPPSLAAVSGTEGVTRALKSVSELRAPGRFHLLEHLRTAAEQERAAATALAAQTAPAQPQKPQKQRKPRKTAAEKPAPAAQPPPPPVPPAAPPPDLEKEKAAARAAAAAVLRASRLQQEQAAGGAQEPSSSSSSEDESDSDSSDSGSSSSDSSSSSSSETESEEEARPVQPAAAPAAGTKRRGRPPKNPLGWALGAGKHSDRGAWVDELVTRCESPGYLSTPVAALSPSDADTCGSYRVRAASLHGQHVALHGLLAAVAAARPGVLRGDGAAGDDAVAVAFHRARKAYVALHAHIGALKAAVRAFETTSKG